MKESVTNRALIPTVQDAHLVVPQSQVFIGKGLGDWLEGHHGANYKREVK